MIFGCQLTQCCEVVGKLAEKAGKVPSGGCQQVKVKGRQGEGEGKEEEEGEERGGCGEGKEGGKKRSPLLFAFAIATTSVRGLILRGKRVWICIVTRLFFYGTRNED